MTWFLWILLTAFGLFKLMLKDDENVCVSACKKILMMWTCWISDGFRNQSFPHCNFFVHVSDPWTWLCAVQVVQKAKRETTASRWRLILWPVILCDSEKGASPRMLSADQTLPITRVLHSMEESLNTGTGFPPSVWTKGNSLYIYHKHLLLVCRSVLGRFRGSDLQRT